MRIIVTAIAALAVVLACAVPVLADTGFDASNEATIPGFEWVDATGSSNTFDHSEMNPAWYKGWWIVTLKNSTSFAWASAFISPRSNDKVAIVQGNGLQDEFSYTNNSVTSSRGNNVAYGPSVGDGYRDYDFGSGIIRGYLYQNATITFSTPVLTGQSVRMFVYTDNSWYTDPASTFSLIITPNAVPEPSSILAMSTALAGLVGFGVRRKR